MIFHSRLDGLAVRSKTQNPSFIPVKTSFVIREMRKSGSREVSCIKNGGRKWTTRVGTRKERGPVCVSADKAKAPIWIVLVPF